jgi:hypothetical protein
VANLKRTPGCPCCSCVIKLATVQPNGLETADWTVIHGTLPVSSWDLEEADQLYLLRNAVANSSFQLTTATFVPYTGLGSPPPNATALVYLAYLDDDNYLVTEIVFTATNCTATLKQKLAGVETTIAGPETYAGASRNNVVVMVTDGSYVEVTVHGLASLYGPCDDTGGRRAGIGTGDLTEPLAFNSQSFERCLCCQCKNKQAALIYFAHFAEDGEADEDYELPYQWSLTPPLNDTCDSDEYCEWKDMLDSWYWRLRISYDSAADETTIEVKRATAEGWVYYELVVSGRVTCREIDGLEIPHSSGPHDKSTCTLTASYLA